MSGIYVFDLDGVLIDSMARYESGTLRVLDEEGIAYDEQLIKFLTPLGYTKTAEYYVNTLGVKGSVESVVQRLKENLLYEYTYNIVLKPFVRAFIGKLKSQGAKVYVLTASPHLVTDVCLKRNGLFDAFDQVWSVDDFSLSKTQTELFDAVAAKIGCCTQEIHFFDDNLIAIQTARKAGCVTYGVYDRQDEADAARLKAAAEHYVASFEQML